MSDQVYYEKRVRHYPATGRLLIVNQKHGSAYYLVDTPERLQRAWLCVCQDFAAAGCYGDLEKPLDSTRLGDLLVRQVALGTNPALQADRKDVEDSIKIEMHELELCNQQRALYLRVKDSSDWLAAFQLLELRSDYEYEGWEIVNAVIPV